MSPAVAELPSGQPTGHGRGRQPYRRPARRVRKIDFAQLDRLSTRADQELRETEDALIVFMERDRLYLKPKEKDMPREVAQQAERRRPREPAPIAARGQVTRRHRLL